jgi:two-component system, NtrC family, sensor kinase
MDVRLPMLHPPKFDSALVTSHFAARQRWSTTIVLLSATVASALAFASYLMVRSIVLEQIKRTVFLEARREADELDYWLLVRLTEVKSIASNPMVHSLDWQVIQPYFDQEVDRIQDFVSLSVGRPDGVYYNSYIGDRPSPGSIADRAYFKAAMAGEANISDPFLSRTLKTNNIAIAAPIWATTYRSKAPIGEVHAQVKIDHLVEISQRLRYGDGSYAFILNRQGEAIIHPNHRLMTTVEMPAPSFRNHADRVLAALTKMMLNGEQDIRLMTIDGTPQYVAYMPLNTAKWSIAVVIPAQNIESQLVSVHRFGMLMMLLPIVTAIVVWQMLRRSTQLQIQVDRYRIQEDDRQQSPIRLKQQQKEIKRLRKHLHQTQQYLLNSQAMSNLGKLLSGVAQELTALHRVIEPHIIGSRLQLEPIERLLVKITPLGHGDTLHMTPQTQRHVQQAQQSVATIQASLQTIQTSTDRLSSLIHAIDRMTHAPHAPERHEFKAVNLNSLIQDTIRLLDNRLASQRHRSAITINWQLVDLPMVECHAASINQVLMHLLENAIEGIETRFYQAGQVEEPLIRLRSQLLSSGKVLIRITDNGCGITEANQARLFTPFFTNKSAQQGIGLGLFICHNIIKQHRGTIRCISIPHRGTDFLIELPIKRRQSKISEIDSSTNSNGPDRKWGFSTPSYSNLLSINCSDRT